MKDLILKFWYCLCFLSLFCVDYTVLAQRGRAYSTRPGFYIGGIVSHNSVGGDFDGESLIVDLNKGLTATVPDIETFFGFGGSVGVRTLQGGFEASYLRYTHDASWLNSSSEAVVEHINIALKRYWLPREQFQPVLHIGWLPYSRIQVSGGMLTTNGLSDSRYKGSTFSFNGGGGLLLHLGPRLSAEGLVLYRYVQYEKVESVSTLETIELADILNGSGLNGSVSLSVVLF